jgi:hypothetical protein
MRAAGASNRLMQLGRRMFRWLCGKGASMATNERQYGNKQPGNDDDDYAD